MSRYLWSSAFLLGLCGVLSGACQPPAQFAIPAGQTCDAPPELSQTLKTQPAIHGCLVLLWQGQSPDLDSAVPILLKPDGSLRGRLDNGEEAPTPGFMIPPAAIGQPLLFRAYLLHSKKSPALESLSDHKLVCRGMRSFKYNCFAPDNEWCWMALQFQPTTSQSTLSAHQLSWPDSQVCRVCQREVCDNKDNNCNGQIDEFDEVNNKPCSK